jgi:hypothetical protein
MLPTKLRRNQEAHHIAASARDELTTSVIVTTPCHPCAGQSDDQSEHLVVQPPPPGPDALDGMQKKRADMENMIITGRVFQDKHNAQTASAPPDARTEHQCLAACVQIAAG